MMTRFRRGLPGSPQVGVRHSTNLQSTGASPDPGRTWLARRRNRRKVGRLDHRSDAIHVRIASHCHAYLAKVGVASSSLVSRSRLLEASSHDLAAHLGGMWIGGARGLPSRIPSREPTAGRRGSPAERSVSLREGSRCDPVYSPLNGLHVLGLVEPQRWKIDQVDGHRRIGVLVLHADHSTT